MTGALVRATLCPEVFVITPAMYAWAAEKVPGVELEWQTEQFLDYHRAKGSRFVNWVAAWQYWMRNAFKWARQRTQGKGTVVRDRIAAVSARLQQEGVIGQQRLELGE